MVNKGFILNIIKNLYRSIRIIIFGNNYYCNYIPSCSEYAFNMLEKENFFKAIYYILKRLINCHPFASNILK
ncbi:MAG: membrane protein insertion efficiency factor YidD [Planctomycetota bacterium]